MPDIDNKHGRNALKAMITALQKGSGGLEEIDLPPHEYISAMTRFDCILEKMQGEIDDDQVHFSNEIELLLDISRQGIALRECREEAIHQGRSISGYVRQLSNNKADISEVKSQIDVEIEKSKMNGLLFNIVAQIWLLDAGINIGTLSDFLQRFLNRILGLSIPRQR